MPGNSTKPISGNPEVKVERVGRLSQSDLNDLCDATDSAIQHGGGFGWVDLPARDILENYWKGVMVMPQRILLVARLDGTICGTTQLVKPAPNNEAQRFAVTLTNMFVTPWARGHSLARKLMEEAEKEALTEGFSVINLDVRETLEAAINLYESMGYIHWGTHPYYAKVDQQVIPGRNYYKVIDSKAVEQEP